MRFEDLKKPFACVAADLYSGESIYFPRRRLGARRARQRMNLPGIFSPRSSIRHQAISSMAAWSNYIPIDAAKTPLGAEWVLASVTESDYTHPSKPRERVLRAFLSRSSTSGASLLSREQRQQADFLIEPPVGRIGMYDTSRIQEAIIPM